MSESMDRITLYVRPHSASCQELELALAENGVAFRLIDIWDDPDAAAYVRAAADGREPVPTVDVAGHALVEPSLHEVLAALAEHAPHLRPGA